MEIDMNSPDAADGRWVKKDNVSEMEAKGWVNTKTTAKRSMGGLVLMTEKKPTKKAAAKKKPTKKAAE